MKMIVVTLIFLLLLPQEKSKHDRLVDVITIDGTINPAAAAYIHDGIKRANDENAECLIIQLNTPGGLLKSTRIIVSDILTSNVPVVKGDLSTALSNRFSIVITDQMSLNIRRI